MPNFMQNFQNFMQNPIQSLMQRKLSIPQQYQNNPHAAVQHLLDSGQVSQEQFNKAFQIAQQMGIKFN